MAHLVPVTRWPDHYPWPSVRTLRHLIRTDRLGFRTRCVRRVGRSVLIDAAAFAAWAAELPRDWPDSCSASRREAAAREARQ